MKKIYTREMFEPSFLKRVNCSLLVLLFLLSVSVNLFAEAPSHDPSRIIRDGDRYYVFSTGDGVWAMSSSTPAFTDWIAEPSPLGNGIPSWINNYVPGFEGFYWAPECIYMNGRFYLYYSCSMGARASAIGVTSTASLNNPNWTDHGMVVYSDDYTPYGSIDADVFFDQNGRLWMTWGSHLMGIVITELNTSTGMPIDINNYYHLANNDCEAAAIIYNEGYYYLFFNRYDCCAGINSNYEIFVGRSRSVNGPYFDKNGNNCADYGGTSFLSSSGRYIGPGHFGYGEGKLSYHFYDGDDYGAPKVTTASLGWSNGWPVAGGSGGWDAGFGDYIEDGTYRLTPLHSGKSIEVANNNASEGENVQQWSYNSLAGQQWEITNTGNNYYKIAPSGNTALAMDVENISIDNGTNIGLWSYWGGNGQLWKFEDNGNGTYNIISKNSGRCLDVDGISTNDGANLVQWDCISGNQNQMFKLEAISNNAIVNGTFAIVAAHSGKALDVYNWGTSDGTNICQWEYWGGESQQFNISTVDGEWHRITPVIATSKSMDIEGISTSAGANVNIWEYWSGSGQQFKFQSAGSGTYNIIARNSEMCLDVTAASTANGANIQQWGCTSGSAWQQFQLIDLKSATMKTVENLEEIGFGIYPNPVSTGNISIKYSLDDDMIVSISILNTQGQLVYNVNLGIQTEGEIDHPINVTLLPKGVYVVSVTIGTQTINEKLIIE